MSPTWLEDLINRLPGWLPPEVGRVAVAVAVVFLGYLLGRLLGYVTGRLLRRLSRRMLEMVDRVSRRDGAEARLEREEAAMTALGLASRIVFWLVFALFLAAATSLVGFPVIATWLEGLASYLPRVLAAAAVVLLGVLAGNLVRAMISAAASAAGFPYARALARIGQVSVVLVAAVVAIEELGIQVTFFIVLAATALGAVLGGAGLAFALGARTAVSNLVARHYLQRSYRIGQRIRVGEHEGRILAIEATAVVLQAAEGRIRIPARELEENASVLLSGEEAA